MRNSACRGCNSVDIHLIYDFGKQPLAGEFPLTTEEALRANRYPLDLTQCRACGLLQVSNVPPISAIFHDDYRYSSSTIPGLVRHFEEYANWIEERIPSGAHVLEFGCNDGVLLGQLAERGHVCKGVDASANIVAMARRRGLDVDVAFFDYDYVSRNSLQGSMDLITCSNVYAHIDKLADVTTAAFEALKEDGLFVIEVHDGDLISTQGHFDTVYHEHLTYFTVDSITRHLESYGFRVEEIISIPMHGGGIRVLSRRVAPGAARVDRTYPDVLMLDGDVIRVALETALRNVRELKQMHQRLRGYGAAGRAQMFLNFTKTSDLFECVYDDSPLRQGRYIVGSDVPIFRFENKKQEGACVILAWNYAETIVEKIAPFFEAVYTVLPQVRRWT